MIPAVLGQLSYSVTVSVQGLPSGMTTNLYLDGAVNGTFGAGDMRTFSFASTGLTHVISVNYYVQSSGENSGTRYYDSSPSWTFSGAGNHVFTYSTQYLLTVQTAWASNSTVGGGWYDVESVAQVTMKDAEVDEGQGTRLIFTGWSGDASGSNLTSNPILMNSPKNAIADWKTQFSLTINSDQSGVENLQGAGWYDSGTQATFSASSAVQANQDSRLRFGSWSGDYSGSSSTGSIVMDRPKVVTAHYVAQYLVSIAYHPQTILSNYNVTSSGWYDADSFVQLGPAPTLISVSSVERLRFTNWIDNGLSIQNVSISVLVDKPHKVVLTYVTQYYVDVQTSHGSVSGSGWYDKGSTAKIAETSDNSWPIAYSFTGWSPNPQSGKLMKTDDSWSLVVDGPYTVQATWTVDYLPLIEIAGAASAGVVLLVASVVLVHRRRLSGKGPQSRKGRICMTCGNIIPEGVSICQKCGASLDLQPTQEPVLPPIEQKVYDYIVKKEGVISMSKAASDLGLSLDQLKEITEKLKKEGRLA